MLSLAFICLSSLIPAMPPAQGCTDPPGNGSHVLHADLSVTLTDGYVTLMDVRIPQPAPGSCGWPLVLFVHGGGGSRAGVAADASEQANLGYVAVSYDVRGQGPARLLNNRFQYGLTDLGLRERLDMFEVLEEAERRFPAAIDFNRIAVGGESQGAVHGWMAAAHSERLPPANPWRAARFPRVSAIFAENFPPDLIGIALPEARTATHMFMVNVFDSTSGIHILPSFKTTVYSFVEDENYEGLDDYLRKPELEIVDLLRTSTVPVLASMVYDDRQGRPNHLTDIWNEILPAAPKLLNLTTGGHGSPTNNHETALCKLRRRQWLDRFLKGVQNGVELEDEVRMSVVPASSQDYNDPNALWDFRTFPSYPPPSTGENWYLRTNGTLSLSPYTGTSSGDLLTSQTQSGYDVTDYINELPTPEELLSEVPLRTLGYNSSSFNEDRLIQGKPIARLYVESSDDPYLVHVTLWDRDQSGNDRFITNGFEVVRGNLPPGQHLIEIPLGITAYVLPDNHRLRLQIENLAWNRPDAGPQASFLHAMPIFENFSVRIHRDNTRRSHIQVPFASFGNPTLTASVVEVRSASLPDFILLLRADPSRDNWDYEILAGTSGTSPGFFQSGVNVPLNRDFVTQLIETNPGSLPISNFTNELDGQGTAVAGVNLSDLGSLPPSVTQITFAAILTSPGGGTVQASNAVTLPVNR